MTKTDWLETLDASPGDPWETWVRTLGFPRRYAPLDAAIEHAVEDAILRADARRLAVGRALPMIWADFRRHHDELDGRGKYRRLRYRIWRAAALKTMLDHHHYQDEAEAAIIRSKLAAVYVELGFGPDGTLSAYCLWQPRSRTDNLETYAADVLALFTEAMPRRGHQ
jgi:hypothetical protein